MWSQPENQRAVSLKFYKCQLEMKWYFWKSNQRVTHGAFVAKRLLFTQLPLDSAGMLSDCTEADSTKDIQSVPLSLYGHGTKSKSLSTLAYKS